MFLPRIIKFLLLYVLIVITLMFGYGVLSNTFIIAIAAFSFLGGYLSYSGNYKNNTIINIGFIVIVAWVVLMVLSRSDFILKKAILYIVKGIYMVIAAFSFNLKDSRMRVRIHGLSVVLVCVWALFKQMNAVYFWLLFVYAVVWMLTFHYLHRNEEVVPNKFLIANIIICSAAVIAVIPFVYFLSKKVYSPAISSIVSVFKAEVRGYGDKLNELEDRMYKAFINFADKNRHAKKKVIKELSAVLSKYQPPLILDRATYKLKNIVKKEGMYTSSKDKKKLLALINEYMQAKTVAGLLHSRDNLYALLNKERINLYDKIKAKVDINKIYAGSDLKSIKEHFDSLRKLIDRDNIIEKSNLRMSLRRFKEWKMQSVYYDRKNTIARYIEEVNKGKNLDAKGRRLSENLSNLLKGVEGAFTIEELVNVYNTFNNSASKENVSKAYPEKELEDILSIKLELILRDIFEDLNSNYNKSLTSPFLSNVMRETEKVVEGDKEEYVIKDINSLIDSLKKNSSEVERYHRVNTLRSLMVGKMFLIGIKDINKVKEILNNSIISPYIVRKIVDSIDSMLFKDGVNVESIYYRLKGEFDRFCSIGQLYGEDRDKLNKYLEDLHSIAEAKRTLNRIFYERHSNNQQNDWEKFLSSLKEEGFINDLNTIMNKMFIARDVNEVEALRSKLYEYIEEADVDRYLKNKAKEYVNKIYVIQKKSLTSRVFIKLMESLSIIEDSKKNNREDLIKIMGKVQEAYMEGGVLDEKLVDKIEKIIDEANIDEGRFVNKKNGGIWEIFVLPDKLIVNTGSTKNIRVFRMYNNRIIQEITPEVHWNIVDESIAWIDKYGYVHPLRAGKTDVFVEYDQEKVAAVEIIVVSDYKGVER